MASLNVVWFKRDLRVHDHEPLVRACERGPVLALYAWEPDLIASPDCATQHLMFAHECLLELHGSLAAQGIPLRVQTGTMPALLDALHREHGIAALYSHEETGNAASYARDRRVASWCRDHGIAWHQSPSNGVVRGLKDRDTWSSLWMKRMRAAPLTPPLTPPTVFATNPAQTVALSLPPLAGKGADKALRQRGGRAAALSVLDSFMSGRGRDYRFAMSSPLSAQDACSRLSPYLAFGVVSIRELVHRLWRERSHAQALPEHVRDRVWLASLKSFESRLHWHCHFIQKLESEPAIELHNMHAAYDGLREPAANRALHDAWATGETGYPMVDACMRMLHATGWVNFRMRAMLVSFASYQLWQPWQHTAWHLAREFLDYEPGIHYPQVQMQSGTTGINTIRIYNPVKQARDHDPEGAFVRRWIPALEHVPVEYVFEPWTMPATVQRECGCVIGSDYPEPVVELEAASRHAREAMWAVRGGPAFRKEAGEIFEKHGSRHPNREGRKRSASSVNSPAKPRRTRAKAMLADAGAVAQLEFAFDQTP
jgi:deoxyribodipyrimidine photo-lyase